MSKTTEIVSRFENGQPVLQDGRELVIESVTFGSGVSGDKIMYKAGDMYGPESGLEPLPAPDPEPRTPMLMDVGGHCVWYVPDNRDYVTNRDGQWFVSMGEKWYEEACGSRIVSNEREYEDIDAAMRALARGET